MNPNITAYVVPKIPSCHPVTSLCSCLLSQGQILSISTNKRSEIPTTAATTNALPAKLNIRPSPCPNSRPNQKSGDRLKHAVIPSVARNLLFDAAPRPSRRTRLPNSLFQFPMPAFISPSKSPPSPPQNQSSPPAKIPASTPHTTPSPAAPTEYAQYRSTPSSYLP